MKSILGSERGFSLIEVLVVFAIMIFISFSISELIWNTYRLRGKLSVEGDFYTSIRLTMNILERDIAHIYHPKVFAPLSSSTTLAQEDQDKLQNIFRVRIDDQTDYYHKFIASSGIRETRFVGTQDEIRFVGSSHTRIYKEAPESVFAKVEFSISDDEYAEVPNSKVLIKRIDTNAFEVEDREDEQFKRTYRLLQGITEVKIRYFDLEKESWVDSWDSASRIYNGRFPHSIEFNLTVQQGETLFYSGRYRFKPEIPFNGLAKSL